MPLDNGNKFEFQTDYSLAPFFELTHDLLCIAGFDGYFRRVNPAVCKVLGYSEEELLSKPISYFQHPDDKEVTKKYRDPILDGKPLTNFENRYITKRGDIVWFAWTSIPVKDEELIYAIAKNITHKKKQEEERNKLLSNMTTSNHRLKQLNYITAHDLRAPVSNLLAVFNLIDTSTINSKETLDFLNILKEASQNLKRTLDVYVDSLNKSDGFEESISKTNVNDVLEDVQQSLYSLITDSNTTFKTNFNAFNTVLFYHPYLESIFLNLITNSIKYSHPERSPVISIHTEIAESKKLLTFSDNGRGFNLDKEKDKVFKLNQKFHDNEDAKGIGLYLVHNHMKAMGGNITVESTVDEGTTFTLTFPG